MRRRSFRWRRRALAAAPLILLLACTDDDPVVPVDTTPPERIDDLQVTAQNPNAVSLRWTAPTDDEDGRATRYYIRYRPGVLELADWDDATAVTNAPVPGFAGANEVFGILGLIPGETFAFGIRAEDASGNLSGLSNMATVEMPEQEGDPGP